MGASGLFNLVYAVLTWRPWRQLQPVLLQLCQTCRLMNTAMASACVGTPHGSRHGAGLEVLRR